VSLLTQCVYAVDTGCCPTKCPPEVRSPGQIGPLPGAKHPLYFVDVAAMAALLGRVELALEAAQVSE
jgi:hypothetical protein